MRQTQHVLLVEDHDDTRSLFAFVIGECGYTVTSCGTMADATRLIINEEFDLFVVDSRLSDGTGLQLCLWIRQIDATTPIVFCSTEGHAKQALQALAAGAQVYLMKPFELDEFRDAVNRLIRRESTRKERSSTVENAHHRN
jgi:DNA-binding response OmpR family regulator